MKRVVRCGHARTHVCLADGDVECNSTRVEVCAGTRGPKLADYNMILWHASSAKSEWCAEAAKEKRKPA
jgi:hypothetical protein